MGKINYIDQHFLINPGIAEAMVSIANINLKDYVLEVGPGKGIITGILLKYAKKVMVIEKDPKMQEFLYKLQEEFPNLEIVIGNALTKTWPKKINKVVANIPFNITEPLLDKLIKERIPIACLLVGEEYANKVKSHKMSDINTSAPSRLAFLTNVYFISKIQMMVPSKNFYPKPSVNGAIITLESIKKQKLVKNFPLYILRNIWDQNTKKVYDSLFDGVINLLSIRGEICYLSRNEFYKSVEVDDSILQKRGSTLTNQDFFQIYQALNGKKIKGFAKANKKNLEKVINWREYL